MLLENLAGTHMKLAKLQRKVTIVTPKWILKPEVVGHNEAKINQGNSLVEINTIKF